MDNVKTGTVCTELLGERSFETSVTVRYTLHTFLDTRDAFEQDGDINIGSGTVLGSETSLERRDLEA